MGYRIEYDGRINQYEIVEHRKSRLPFLLSASFMLFILVTLVFWQDGAEYLKFVLIPGENAVTVQAFRNMTNDLRSGAGLRDAVFTFCESVIYGQ